MANILKNTFTKKVQETPEIKIAKANSVVGEQRYAFEAMISEIEHALEVRMEAQEELNKEIASLEAQVRAKRDQFMNAQDQNRADAAYKQRLEELLGN